MKLGFAIVFSVAFGVPLVSGQVPQVEPTSTPHKVVITNNLPPATRIVQPTPKPQVVADPEVMPSTIPTVRPRIVTDDTGTTTDASFQPQPSIDVNNLPSVPLSFGEIKSRIAEARRQLQAKPQLIASDDPKIQTGWVRIAFMDPRSSKIDFVSLSKELYLKTGAVNQSVATDGRLITIRTIRANGVNTPIQLVDSSGVAQLPLMVQYPVERRGRYVETAYYMSTHPGLVTPEVVNAGKLYVHNTIEIARDRLRQKGISIQSGVADIAERLATVEHVDHDRFRKEYQKNIYDDIFTLYALNEGQTFRYSVSSAGAGGMVQMIPATYAMIRRLYPNVGLMPDFVEGMRNHVNATQAMLLYMQMTWNDISSNSSVANAMASGIASQKQLMAAGYNSNPAKLGGYIDRGGSNWTSLIPRETQIYLQIYDSLERFVPMPTRTR
jgi:hypothetical protein